MTLPKGVSGNPKGRPPGAINKFSASVIDKAAAEGLLPHEILLSFARGERQVHRKENPETGEVVETGFYPDPDMRLTAANMAAPYFAPKLAQVQHKGVQKSADQVSDDELLRIATDIEPIDGSGRDDVIEG
jgi:hypothetical protein